MDLRSIKDADKFIDYVGVLEEQEGSQGSERTLTATDMEWEEEEEDDGGGDDHNGSPW